MFRKKITTWTSEIHVCTLLGAFYFVQVLYEEHCIPCVPRVLVSVEQHAYASFTLAALGTHGHS